MDSEPTHLSPAVKREREEDLRDPNTTSTLARKRSVSAESSHIPSPAASEARDPLFKKTGAALEPPSATMSFSSSSSDRTEPLLVSPTRPSGPEQLEKINVLRQKPLQQGDKWFIIAEPWYQRWSTACGGPQTLIDKSKANEPVSLSEVGPIDNRPVRYPGTSRLLQAPVEGTDAEFVPEEAWQLLQSWSVL